MNGEDRPLFLALPLPSLSTAELRAAGLVAAGSYALRLTGLGLLEMVLGNPFLLVATSSGRGDSANRSADGRDFALLRLRNEGKVCVIADTTKETKDDEVSYPPEGWLNS